MRGLAHRDDEATDGGRGDVEEVTVVFFACSDSISVSLRIYMP